MSFFIIDEGYKKEKENKSYKDGSVAVWFFVWSYEKLGKKLIFI